MRPVWTLAVLASFAGIASAQTISTIASPFVGDRTEDFDLPNSTAFPTCIDNGVFETPGGTDWAATACSASGSAHITTGWGYICNIYSYGGPRFTASTSGAYVFDFSLGGQDVTKFGGYFGTNSVATNATVTFYDGSNNVIDQAQVVTFPGCGLWTWAGWQITGGAARRVEIQSNHSNGGYCDLDSLQVSFGGVTPPPTVYCTAGTTTNGCLGSISASGNPNVAHNNTCVLSVSGVEGQKSGILFYGLSQNIQAWCSVGGNSFLCVKAPTQRTIAQPSGGTLGACDGTFALDWNAWQNANAGALGQPFAAGNQVYVQGWFRDPPACKTTNMTDAVSMTYLP
jgi:hypothetical protein